MATSHDTARPDSQRLVMTSPHHGEARESISNRSMSLKREKSSMVVLWVKGFYYTMKRGSSQIIGAATTRSQFSE